MGSSAHLAGHGRRLLGRWAFALPALVLALAAGIPTCGCDGGGREVKLSGRALRDSFALYYPVPAATAARVAPYAVGADLSGVAGLSAAALDQEARRVLVSQGFVAEAGKSGSIDEAYRGITAAKFVTLDAPLYAFHRLSSRILERLEREVFRADLEKLVPALLEVMSGMYGEAGGTVRGAALADLAYLGVAARLLGLEVGLPPEADEIAEAELSLVSGAAGVSVSPLLGAPVDYGRFRTRGRFGPGSGMEGYLQAFTWLGEMGLTLAEGTGPGEISRGRDNARRAVLLVGALHEAEADGEPALTIWDRVYQANAFLSGAESELDVHDLTRVMSEVMGTSFRLEDLEDDSVVDELIKRAAREVEGAPGRGAEPGETANAGPCFRLLGVRGRLEDAVFSRLAGDEVPGRLLPRGLDLPAALGSDRALQLLDGVYGDAGSEDYRENLAELRTALATVEASPARIDLPGGWLDVQRLALDPRDEGYPLFMRGAWQDRCLYSFLGAWVELGSDEAGEPPGQTGDRAASVGGSEKGYVEPLPEAFAKLAALADMLRRGLRERGLSDAESEERLDALHAMLLTLKAVAEKELRNEAPSAEEYAAVAAIGDTLSFICSLPLGDPEGGHPSGGAYACAVSDLYRDPVYDEVLQAATGRPVTYYVIAPVEGRPTLTVGAGFSYYEFVRPAGGRYTTSSWSEAVGMGALPDPPAWTASFLR